MFKCFIVLIIVAVILSSLVLAEGVDDQGNPNDPDNNDRANACYDGGDMTGNCDTLWEWVCGWHVIRLDAQDEASRVAFPQGCVSLLPPIIREIIAEDIVIIDPLYGLPGGDCIFIGSGEYTQFGGGNYLPNGSPTYFDLNCTNITTAQTSALVYAPSGIGDALTLCVAHNYTGFTDPLVGDDVYICT